MAFTLKPATGTEFVNREDVLKDMLSTLGDVSSGIGFALYGKRKMGKTSIFKEVERRLPEGVVPIYFSVWDLSERSIEAFTTEFTIAILEAFKPHLSLKYKVKDLLATPFTLLSEILQGLKLSVDVKDTISLLLTFRREERIDAGSLIDDVFSLPEKLAKETNTKCVLLIDEFPSMADLKAGGSGIGNAIFGKIRTINEDYSKTVLCISGSIRKTMNLAAFSPSSAFYRQFIGKLIGPLERRHVAKIMEKNHVVLTEDGLERLYEFSRGTPFYVQFLGRLLREAKESGRQEVERAIEEFLTQEGNLLFREEFDALSDKERATLIAMSVRDIHRPSEIAKALTEKITNVSTFLSYLENKAILAKEERGIYVFEDPVFREWINRKYS